MRAGQHPISTETTWPDGRPTTHTIKFNTYHRPNSMHDSHQTITVPQHHDYSRATSYQQFIFRQGPVHPTSAVQNCVNRIMQQHIHEFDESSNWCPPKLAGVDATPYQIAASLEAWMKSTLWEEWLDILLERSWEAEINLCELIDRLRGQLRVFRRIRSKRFIS